MISMEIVAQFSIYIGLDSGWYCILIDFRFVSIREEVFHFELGSFVFQGYSVSCLSIDYTSAFMYTVYFLFGLYITRLMAPFNV